jgi:hypothetical protein
MPKDTYIFTSEELWFLYNQFAPISIVGLKDPTIGLLANEIQELISSQREGLKSKGIIAVSKSSNIVINEHIAEWINLVVKSDHTILLIAQNGDSLEKVHSFHFSKNKIIKLEALEVNKYKMCEIKKAHEILVFLQDFFPTDSSYAQEEPVVLASNTLNKIYSYLEKKQLQKTRNILEKKFTDPLQLERFMNTISDPTLRLSVIGFLSKDSSQLSATKGFSVLVSRNMIWLLQPTNKTYAHVQISLTSTENLCDMFQTILPK